VPEPEEQGGFKGVGRREESKFQLEWVFFFPLFFKWKQDYGTLSPTEAIFHLLLSDWTHLYVALIVGRPSPSAPNFGQKTKGFKISSWGQIKQQYLTTLCFFFLLVRGLSSQYFSVFPRGISDSILSWTFVCWSPCLYFPFFPSGWLCSVNQELKPPFALEFSYSLILFPFCTSLAASLVGTWGTSWQPVGQYKLLTWIRFKNLIPPYEFTSELQIRTPLSLRVTQHISFAHQTASSILTTKTLLGHPHDISCLGLCTKFMWSPWILSSELLYSCFQECISLGKGPNPGWK
jgi:hypothetical protein